MSQTAVSVTAPQDQVLQMVHVTPGRVRFRVPQEQRQTLQDQIQPLQTDQGIEAIAINPETGSLIISFNPSLLTLADLQRMLETMGFRVTAAASVQAHWNTGLETLQSGAFWREQGLSLVPLVTGLLTTRSLGVQGLLSLPVFMAAASVTRLAIAQWETTNHDPEPEAVTAAVARTPGADTATAIAPTATSNWQLLHATPGRLRIRVPRMTEDADYRQRLQTLARNAGWMTQVQLRPHSGSIVITYDRTAMSQEVARSRLQEWLQQAEVTPVPATTTQPVPVVPAAEPPAAIAVKQTSPSDPPDDQPPSDNLNLSDDLDLEVVQLDPDFYNGSSETPQGFLAEFKPPALAAILSFAANFPLLLTPVLPNWRTVP